MTKSPGSQITGALLETPAARRFEIDLGRKAAGSPILVYPPTQETLERVIPGPSLPLRMRNLIPQGSTTGSGILYTRETSITNSPIVPTAPGNVKPAANLTYEVLQQPVVTIPAYLKMPSQYWEDFNMFEGWIDTRLMYSLAAAEEKQLLNGDGTGANLQGLMMVALPVTTVAGTGGGALLDNIAAGIASVFAHEYVPDGIVLNPANFGSVLTARATAGGNYLAGEPLDVDAPFTLWGIPVVLSTAMASGSYLVGQFNPFCQIFDREDAAVEVATQDQDDFVRNLVAVRAEERPPFAVYQPGAFGKGTYTP